MYSGFSKNNGSVIGDTSKGCEIDIEEAQDSTAAEESMICMDDNGNEIVLTAMLDNETGDLKWCQMYQKEEVMQRTIGMSQMTSMMRDEDRNRVYEKAILILLNSFAEEHGRAPIVLDIGAGTGLLSMMAVRGGAEFALGVEMFDAMSTVAENVINANDFGDKILIINAKSSEIEDLPVPADLLISELLDSALLGEGCLPSHLDAMQRLMNPLETATSTNEQDEDGVSTDFSNRVLPFSGIVFGTLIESLEVKHMHDAESIALGGDKLHKHRRSPEITIPPCKGGLNLIPLHWTEVHHRGGRELSTPMQLLHPNFTLTTSEEEKFSTPDQWYCTDITVTTDGIVHGVLLWWNLYLLSPKLDPSRECCYSTAPGAQNWQDHWQQTAFPLTEDIPVQQGDVLRIYAMHDQVQIHIHAKKLNEGSSSSTEPDCKRHKANDSTSTTNTTDTTTATTTCMTLCNEVPMEIEEDGGNICTCGWHNLCGAERFQTMCDVSQSATWDSAIQKVVTSLSSQSVGLVLDLGDGSLLGHAAALKLKELNSTVQVVSKEAKLFSRMFFSQMAAANSLEDQLTIWDGEDMEELAVILISEHEDDEQMLDEKEHEEEVDLTVLQGSILAIVGECHYYQMQALPTWQMLSFYFQVQALRKQNLLSPQCRVLPGKALIRVLPLELPNLRRCHGLAGVVNGFDHSALDAQQENWHTHIYPYKLANYQYTALSAVRTIAELDFTVVHDIELMSGLTLSTPVSISHMGSCDAIAIWVDYVLDDNHTILQYTAEHGFVSHQTINLKFFSTPSIVQSGDQLQCSIALDLMKNDFIYDFTII